MGSFDSQETPAKKPSNKYAPKWNIGDVFYHILTFPKAEEIGIGRWAVIFYKISEYTDLLGQQIQLVYVFLSPPDKLPKSCKDLLSLGFLRMMNHDDKWDYLAQITVKSKRDEAKWELTALGNFGRIELPCDRVIENPFVSMPLFNFRQEKTDTWLAYEDQICRIYQWNGTNKARDGSVFP